MSFNEWKSYKLGELAKVQTGPFGSQLHVSDYTGEGIPVVMPVNIGSQKILDEKVMRVSCEKADSLSKHKLKNGDLIFSRRGDVERHAFVHPENVGWLCGTGCLKIAVNEEHVSRFISYQLLLPEKKKWLSNHAVGTTMPNLNTTILSSIDIQLPKFPMQQKIASILSSLDDKIELNRQTNQTLEAIAQVLFKEMCLPKDDELPGGWKVGKLGDILESKGGTKPSTKNEEFWNGKYHWATPKDLSNLKVPVLLSTERQITDKGLKQISSGLLPKGTLLMSSRAPIGYFAVTEIPVAVNQGFIAVNGTSVSNLFLLHWLKHHLDMIKGMANGSTFLEISKSVFRQIQIAIPSVEVLTKFDKVAQPLFDKLVANEKEIQTLICLRDDLLPKLMKGEIKL